MTVTFSAFKNRKDCRGKRPKRPRTRKPCPGPGPRTPKPPPPVQVKPRQPKPAPRRPTPPGQGQCWKCKFWTSPVDRRPNYGVCELTTLVNLKRNRYPRALGRVAVIDGLVESTAGTEISLITVKQFGCPSWERE